MKLPNFIKSYKKHIDVLLKAHAEEKAMSLAVGGEFEAVGLLEYYLLLQLGLKENDTVIDVGCGSGRLAYQLSKYWKGHYVGLDVVPELLRYAKKLCNRPEWKFYVAPGLTISEPEETADYVCFFSVFTHLLHEESYRYLQEAKRVLKPNGKIIFSFLEFAISSHWSVFESTLNDNRPDKVLNQFVSRDAIQSWREHLGLKIIDIFDGDKPHLKLLNPVSWDDGREMVEIGNLGQSVCILTK